MAILGLAGAWLTGIALIMLGVAPPGVGPWLAIAAGALGGLALSLLYTTPAGERRGSRRGVRAALGCGLFCALGALRMIGAAHTPTAADIDYYNRSGILAITGVIDDAPAPTDQGLRLRLATERIALPGASSAGAHPVQGALLVEIRAAKGTVNLPDLRYGDRIRVIGEPQPTSETGPEAYRAALARAGVYATLYLPSGTPPLLTLLERDQGSPFLAASYALRATLYDRFLALLPAPQSALLAGIVLGIDRDLPPAVQDAFRRTGASHIVAISGSNISVVAALLLVLLGGVRPRALRGLLLIAALSAYTVFVGASPSVVRAALMAALVLIAEMTGRRGWGPAALALTVLIQTAINPLVAADPGFLLSALATLGILIYLRPLERIGRAATAWMRPHWLARLCAAGLAGLSTNLAVQVTALPVQLALAGGVSPLSVIVNALVVPAQPAIMTLGLACAIVALIWLPVAQILAWLAYLPAAYTLWVIGRGADVIGALPPVPFEPGALVFYYGALLYLTLSAAGARARSAHTTGNAAQAHRTIRGGALIRRVAPLVSTAGAGIAILTWGAAGAADGTLHAWLLPVGEPGAVLVRTPHGGTVLIDGGASGTKLAAALGDALPYQQRQIDLLILTATGDPRSYAAVTAITARYRFDRVAVLRSTRDDSAATLGALRAALPDSAWTELVPGAAIHSDDGTAIAANAEGDGLSIGYGAASIRLPGAGRSALIAVDPHGKVTWPTEDIADIAGIAGIAGIARPSGCGAQPGPDGARRYAVFNCPALEIRTDGHTLQLTR